MVVLARRLMRRSSVFDRVEFPLRDRRFHSLMCEVIPHDVRGGSLTAPMESAIPANRHRSGQSGSSWPDAGRGGDGRRGSS